MKAATLWCFILFASAGLLAQQSDYSPEKWAHIEQRWLESQPVIMAYCKSGQVISGQQIHASSDSLFILQDKGLPLGPDWQKYLISVHINDVIHILFQAGGNKMGRKKHAETLRFPASNAAYSEPHVLLRNKSVYIDSLYNPMDLNDAMGSSDLLSRAFRKKILRLSLGVSFGGDPLSQEIKEGIDNSDLPFSRDSYGRYVNMETLNVSVRLFNRLILGGSFFSRTLYTNVYGNAYNEVWDVSYDYHVNFREHSIYAEYALLHTDRFFSRRTELIGGAGLLLSKPEWRFSYMYFDVQNPDYDADPHHYFDRSENLLGLQLKGEFHYYLFPGLSLWTALDVNLNQAFVVPELVLPTSEGQEPIFFPEHELGFSSVRIKLGLSLYL